MEMATTLIKYLAQHGIAYDRLSHRHSDSSINCAHAAHIPDDRLAKSVILEDAEGYLMAVIPANRHLKIGRLNKVLHRNMVLATEAELGPLFADCEAGAVPPFGQAYGMETLVDSGLDNCKDIYFEAGNHEELVRVKGADFRKLMKRNRHAALCMG